MEELSLKSKGILGWADFLVPVRYFSDLRSLRKARLLVLFYLATAGFLLIFALFYFYIDYRLGVWACLYGASVVPVLLFVFYRTGSYPVTTSVFNANAILMFTLLIYGTGGIHSCIVPWMAIIPASGFVFDGWRRGLLMSIVCFAVIVALAVLEYSGTSLPMLYNLEYSLALKLVVQIGLVAYIFMILMIYEVSRERTIQQLDRLNADLAQRKQEVEQQREALAESNRKIADINANLENLVTLRTANLEQAKKELDTFLYEAAHALRRPVARIMGLVSILRDQPENPPLAQTMNGHIDTSTELMDQILHKLILVSELDTRRMEKQRVGFRGLVEKLMEERRAKVEANDGIWAIEGSAEMESGMESAKPLELLVDPFLLEVALANVLDNAIQYTAKTGRRPEIHLSITEQDHVWIIQVRDNGLGIPASEIHRVTEMFFRATEKVPGGGLGLYVVQKAMDCMGGMLRLESEQNVGTRVELWIPKED